MSKTTILIVEDEGVVAMDLAARLSQLGYEIIGITARGEEAVAMVRRRRPDLVLMDICLQGAMDGIEAATILRREWYLPVIYLTAHSDPATLERAKLTEPYGFILKPFEELQLETQIEMALYKYRSELRLRLREERFRSVIDGLLDAFAILEPLPDQAGATMDFRLEYLNRVGLELTRQTWDEVGGRRLSEFFPAPTVAALTHSYRNLVQTGEPLIVDSFRWRVLRPAGEEHLYLDLRAWRLEEKLAVTWRDVTDRRHAEEALFERSRLLELEVAEREKVQAALAVQQHQLRELNRLLEERIVKAVEESREKDQMMIVQSRQAAMGEMIGNIAHQWRQPLATLGMILANLKAAHQANDLDTAALERGIAKGNQLIQKMSTTINDFRNFFRPEKERLPFSARKQVEEAIALVESSFSSSNILILFEAGDDFTLFGFPNEYSQVLLNLLTNAKEAIVGAKVGEGRVTIRLAQEGEYGCITFADNGGGIPEESLERIFEPYFSTKPLGTGIGLYMSKMIIERSMHGRITARNRAGGAEFCLSIPLAAKENP